MSVPFSVEVARTVAEAERLAQAIEAIGPVTPLALEEHAEEVKRLDFLTTQRDDLVEARAKLQEALLEIEQTALIGLSYGGRVAIDVALRAPERIWALAAVAPGLSGHDGVAYTAAQEAAYDSAIAEGDLGAACEIDFSVWAPLGVDERIRRLWHATPDANPLPPGVEPLPPAAPAKARLRDLAPPTIVVTVAHDPPGFREIGPLIAREAPNARHVELDSDHYVTLREPELLGRLLVDFLAEAAPHG